MSRELTPSERRRVDIALAKLHAVTAWVEGNEDAPEYVAAYADLRGIDIADAYDVITRAVVEVLVKDEGEEDEEGV